MSQNVSFGAAEEYVLIEAIIKYYKSVGKMKSRVYIAHRIYKYSVKPVSWLSYGHLKEYLNGYYVLDTTMVGILNALLESKFVLVNFKSVKTCNVAIEWSAIFE